MKAQAKTKKKLHLEIRIFGYKTEAEEAERGGFFLFSFSPAAVTPENLSRVRAGQRAAF